MRNHSKIIDREQTKSGKPRTTSPKSTRSSRCRHHLGHGIDQRPGASWRSWNSDEKRERSDGNHQLLGTAQIKRCERSEWRSSGSWQSPLSLKKIEKNRKKRKNEGGGEREGVALWEGSWGSTLPPGNSNKFLVTSPPNLLRVWGRLGLPPRSTGKSEFCGRRLQDIISLEPRARQA